jgi:hypothetical protein
MLRSIAVVVAFSVLARSAWRHCAKLKAVVHF